MAGLCQPAAEQNQRASHPALAICRLYLTYPSRWVQLNTPFPIPNPSLLVPHSLSVPWEKLTLPLLELPLLDHCIFMRGIEIWLSQTQPPFHPCAVLGEAPTSLRWKAAIMYKLPQEWRGSTHLSICGPCTKSLSLVYFLQIPSHKGKKIKKVVVENQKSMSTNSPSFPSPWVWARPTDSHLTETIAEVTMDGSWDQVVRAIAFLLRSFSLITHSGGSQLQCHKDIQPEAHMARNLGLQPIATWVSHFGNPSPSSAFRCLTPQPTTWHNLMRDLSQNHLAKPLPYSIQKWWKIRHLSSFKPVHFSHHLLWSNR